MRIDLLANLHLDVSKLTVSGFLNEHKLGLEELSKDLTQLFLSKDLDLTEVLIQDYLVLSEEWDGDLKEETLRSEFTTLKNEVLRVMQQHALEKLQFCSAHLLHPHTLVLEFSRSSCTSTFLDWIEQGSSCRMTSWDISEEPINRHRFPHGPYMKK